MACRLEAGGPRDHSRICLKDKVATVPRTAGFQPASLGAISVSVQLREMGCSWKPAACLKFAYTLRALALRGGVDTRGRMR